MSQFNPALELDDLLGRAAEISTRNGLTAEQFMAAAWKSYIAANPRVVDDLVDKELRAQLKKLRRQGLVGQA